MCYLHLLAFSRVSGTKHVAGLLEDFHGNQRVSVDEILNKNDRLYFKLNKNKPSEEHIELSYILPLERFIFICLCIKEEDREIESAISVKPALVKGLQTI